MRVTGIYSVTSILDDNACCNFINKYARSVAFYGCCIQMPHTMRIARAIKRSVLSTRPRYFDGALVVVRKKCSDRKKITAVRDVL